MYHIFMTTTLSITQARNELPLLVNSAKKKLSEYIITVNGSPAAVLISAAEYDSWKETDEILANSGLMKAIKKGEEDVKTNRIYDWEDVKNELRFQNQKNVPDKAHRSGKKRT
jgi:prevent-host-death family protein